VQELTKSAPHAHSGSLHLSSPNELASILPARAKKLRLPGRPSSRAGRIEAALNETVEQPAVGVHQASTPWWVMLIAVEAQNKLQRSHC
jgi:hypothetical protein